MRPGSAGDAPRPSLQELRLQLGEMLSILQQVLILVLAGDGKDHPLGNVHRVVADALQILGDLHEVERLFPVGRVLVDELDHILLHGAVQFVHRVILADNGGRQGRIFFDKASMLLFTICIVATAISGICSSFSV